MVFDIIRLLFCIFFSPCIDCENQTQIPYNLREVYTINHNLPGPTLQVCQNDIVLIDVTNHIPGQEVTLHWRGQTQAGTQVMDGVPMVTQCPITSFTTFQYKFRVTIPGTHIWHAHSDKQAANGIFGALIVKQPDVLEPQRRLYDVDTRNYVILVSEIDKRNLFSEDNEYTILVNGRNKPNDIIFKVKKGLRYRFRSAFAAGLKGCPIEVSIDDHLIRIIELDGHPINPYESSSFIFSKGERVDFVLKANQDSGKYLIRFSSKCGVNTSAVLAYEDGETNKREEKEIGRRVFRTDMCESELGRVCLADVQSLFVMPASLRSDRVDTKMYLEYNQRTVPGEFGKFISN